MKTLKQVHTADERAAKIVGAIVNTALTIAGASFCLYGIALFVVKNHLFNF